MRQTNRNERKKKVTPPPYRTVANAEKSKPSRRHPVLSPYGVSPASDPNEPKSTQYHPGKLRSPKNIVPKAIDWPGLLRDEIQKFSGEDPNKRQTAKAVAKTSTPYLYYAVEDLYEKRQKNTKKFAEANNKFSYGNVQPKYVEPFWVRQDPMLLSLGTFLTLGIFWATWLRQQLFGLSLSLQIMLPDNAYTAKNMWFSPLKYSRLLVKYIEIIEKKYNLLRSPYEDLIFLAYFPPLFIYAAQKRLNRLSEFFSF